MVREKPRQRQEPAPGGQNLALIVAALGSGASAASIASSLSPRLGVSAGVLLPVLRLALSRKAPGIGRATAPPPGPDQPYTATNQVARAEPVYRAAYIEAAAGRLKGLTEPELSVALTRERRFFKQHLHAARNRYKAAELVQRAESRYGGKLGWYAKMDARTSTECKTANGKNFDPQIPPPIGFPGSVHPHCRCRAGKPHRTRQTVYSIKPERRSA